MIACERDRFEVVKLLVEQYGANIDHQDEVIPSAYYHKRHHITCLIEFDDYKYTYFNYSQEGYTPSFVAVKEYNLDIVSYLRSKGADLKLKAKNVCRIYYVVACDKFQRTLYFFFILPFS